MSQNVPISTNTFGQTSYLRNTLLEAKRSCAYSVKEINVHQSIAVGRSLEIILLDIISWTSINVLSTHCGWALGHMKPNRATPPPGTTQLSDLW